MPGRVFFRKGNPRTHHLHVTDIGSEFWERHLVFRDYLRAHPETVRAQEATRVDAALRSRHR